MFASFQPLPNLYGLPPWLSGNKSAGKAGATGDGFDPRVGKIPGRRAWKLTLVYSCLEKPMARGTGGLQSIRSHSLTQLKRLSAHTHISICWHSNPSNDGVGAFKRSSKARVPRDQVLFKRDPTETPSSFYHVKSQKAWLIKQEESLPQNVIMLAPWP